MKDIRIYDFGFNLLHIENEIVSQSYREYFNDIGKAEIHLPKNSDAAKVLFENKYLFMTQGKRQAVITGMQLGEECIIYGRTPNWILSKKVLAPFASVTENAEELVRNSVRSAFEDCDDFMLGGLCGLSAEGEFCEESYICLADFVKSVLGKLGAGHRVRLDVKNKKWVFEVLKSNRRNLVISESALNCRSTEYMFDLQDFFTSGIYERELTEEETESGASPVWEEIHKEENSGIYKWETVLGSSTQSDAVRELESLITDEQITAELKNIKCGTDYTIGDVVSVQFFRGSLKKTAEVKVLGADFWEEAGDCGERPMFGKL